MDTLSPEERSRRMSLIRGKNTKPEMVVRRLVFSLGFRYRVHVRSLPGSPDLVFTARQKVIFVHGCFWHSHSCRRMKPRPQTRPEYWNAKLEGNKNRDKRHAAKLRRLGWKVLTIWECQVSDIEALERRIVAFLDERSG